MTNTSKTVRTTNQGARKCVQARQPFRNSNGQLYGAWHNDSTYVVYSYGPHWPLFIYDRDADCWYGNEDKVSRTTSHHRSYAYPLGTATAPLPRSCQWMKDYLFAPRAQRAA